MNVSKAPDTIVWGGGFNAKINKKTNNSVEKTTKIVCGRIKKCNFWGSCGRPFGNKKIAKKLPKNYL